MPANILAVNGTNATKTSGGISVPAYSTAAVAAAADADIAGFVNLGGTAVTLSGQTSSVRHFIRKVLGIGTNPGV